jgi:glutaredoxin
MKAKIYSKENCPFCVNAKQLLNVKNIPYDEIEIGRDITREEFLNILPDAKTVPQIFMIIDGIETKIGGYTDLVKYFE